VPEKLGDQLEVKYYTESRRTGISHTIKIRKPYRNGHILHKKCPRKDIIERKMDGRIEVIGRQGRRWQ